MLDMTIVAMTIIILAIHGVNRFLANIPITILVYSEFDLHIALLNFQFSAFLSIKSL